MSNLFHEIKVKEVIQLDEILLRESLPYGLGIDSRWKIFKDDKKLFVCSSTYRVRDNQDTHWCWILFEAHIETSSPYSFTILFPEQDLDWGTCSENNEREAIQFLQEFWRINLANLNGVCVDENGVEVHTNEAFNRGTLKLKLIRKELRKRIGRAIKRMNRKLI